MRRHPVAPYVLVAALHACVVEPELLNSERIEAEFGSFGIEILSYRNNVRRSSLYSKHDGVAIGRTYAVVQFAVPAVAAVADEHEKVLDGASLGATFKAAGYTILKQTYYIGSVVPGRDPHDIAALMQLDAALPLAMHVYKLVLKKQQQVIEYATIIEVHHPEYMSADRLYELYAPEPPPDVGDDAIRSWRALVGGAAQAIEAGFRSD